MACILEDGKLTLTGDVGDFGFGEFFSHAQVVIALARIEDDADLTVYLNSGGGYVDDGAAIHALLSRRSGTTGIVVDGIAASSASLIAMAGDTVTMTAGAVMMIHDPAQITLGNIADHNRTIEELEAFANAFARIYAAKSGKTVAECRAIMRAERWMAADEAIAEGFADESSGKQSRPVAAFDYRAYAHAPHRLTALASTKRWERPIQQTNQGPKMTTTPNSGAADAHASATARIKAIMQAPEATGRSKLAEHLAFDTTMETDAAIAVMKVAPSGEDSGIDDFADRRSTMRADGRLNGQGLGGGGRGPQSEGGIVAAMKQRYAAK